jgi:hypothetical protein
MKNSSRASCAPVVIDGLNQSTLSVHLDAMLRSRGDLPKRGQLTIMALLAWVVEHHYQDSFLGQLELAALVDLARRAPNAAYSCLADDRMLEANSLEEAAEVLVSRLSDLFDDRSVPQRGARPWQGEAPPRRGFSRGTHLPPKLGPPATANLPLGAVRW